MTVGNTSLDDWPRLTSSLGWIGLLLPGAPPASWMARLAMTSLAFMFDCVPEPVWKATSGNSSSHLPAITSSAARTMRSALSGGSWPSFRLASGAGRRRGVAARRTEAAREPRLADEGGPRRAERGDERILRAPPPLEPRADALVIVHDGDGGALGDEPQRQVQCRQLGEHVAEPIERLGDLALRRERA